MQYCISLNHQSNDPKKILEIYENNKLIYTETPASKANAVFQQIADSLTLESLLRCGYSEIVPTPA